TAPGAVDGVDRADPHHAGGLAGLGTDHRPGEPGGQDLHGGSRGHRLRGVYRPEHIAILVGNNHAPESRGRLVRLAVPLLHLRRGRWPDSGQQGEKEETAHIKTVRKKRAEGSVGNLALSLESEWHLHGPDRCALIVAILHSKPVIAVRNS